MRKDFLRTVVGHLQGAGATVFFSSHLLYEIEPVADVIGILDRGRMVVQVGTDDLREKVKRLILPAAEYERIGPLPGELDRDVRGAQAAVVVQDAAEALAAVAAGGATPQVVDLNLDEIFEAYVIGRRGDANDSNADVERVA